MSRKYMEDRYAQKGTCALVEHCRVARVALESSVEAVSMPVERVGLGTGVLRQCSTR